MSLDGPQESFDREVFAFKIDCKVIILSFLLFFAWPPLEWALCMMEGLPWKILKARVWFGPF